MSNQSREHITCLYMLTAENLISAVPLDLINLISMGIGKRIGLGAATSAIDTAFNLGTGLLMNKIQYDQQNALMDKSFEQQLDFWHQQQAYNDPSSQMRRLREAGLNPAMINGNGVNNTAGGLSSVATPSAPPITHGNVNVAQSAQSLQSILKMAEETGYIDTQNQVMAQELINKIIQNEIAKIAKEMQLDEKTIKHFEMLSNELDFEEKFQFAFGRPSKEGGEMLANNRLTDYSNHLKAQATKDNAQANESQSRADKAEAERLFTEALTATENALRDARVQTEKARATAENASASANLAQANKLIQEGKLVANQADRDAFKRSAETFFGFNFDGIDSELVASFMLYYSDVYSGEMDPSVALNKAKNDLQSYIDHDLYFTTTESYSVGASGAWGLLSGSGSVSETKPHSLRRRPGGGASTW